MSEREAQEIVRMVESAWKIDYGQEGRKLWREMLYRYDPDVATRALAELSQRLSFRPTVADLKNAILKVRADDAAARMDALPRGNGRAETSEWVWVWSWARFKREPQDWRPFPQQSGHRDPLNQMSTKEYGELRDEWLAAGSPKAEHPIPMAR